MEMRRTERLFERFRARGDLRALGEVFDRTAPELLALATHLTRELADAEDVLQATFVTAIERAGTWDRSRRLVPWLCGILVNHAKTVLRREASQAVRVERASVSDGRGVRADGDPVRDVAAGEVVAIVADALRSLPAREREVLERHLVREERAVDIARALGRAPGTVRMQIHRGLERLRRVLPPGTVAGLVPGLETGLVPGSASRGCAAVREAVLGHARAYAPAAGFAGAGSAVSFGVLGVGGAIVSTKLVMSLIGALGAAALGWFLLGPSARVEALRPRGAEHALEAGASLALAPSTERAPRGAAERPSAAPDAREALSAAPIAEEPVGPPPGWYVVGEVLGLRDGDDPREVSVNVFCFAAQTHRLAAARARDDGTFEVDVTEIVNEVGPRARELLVSANHPLYVSGNAFAEPSAIDLARPGGERTEWAVELVLQRASGVRGRVEIPGGDPADVALRLFPVDAEGRRTGDGREIGCEEDGSYDLLWNESGDFGLVASAAGRLPAGLRVSIPRETIVAVEPLVLSANEVAIEGRIAFPAGRVTAGSVWAEREGGPPRVGGVGWDGERATPATQRARLDADGGFRVEGLTPGHWSVTPAGFEDVVLLAPGGFTGSFDAPEPAPGPRAARVEAPAVGVVLDAGAAWLDVLVTADGEPLAGASVEVAGADGDVRAAAETPASGRLTFLATEPGTWRVTVEKAGCERATRTVRLDAGEVVAEVELVRSATGSLVITADEALRRELPSVKVDLEHVGADDEPLDVVLDLTHGTARVDGLGAGRWIVEVEPEEGSFGPYYESYRSVERFEIEVEPGATVRHRLEPELGGRARIVPEGFGDEVEDLSATLIGPGGSPIRGRFVTRRYAANVISVGVSIGALGAHGTSMLYPNLAPGTYQLVLEREGWSVEPVAFTIVAGETVDVRVRGARR